MNGNKQSVLILGGGWVGLPVAYELRKGGYHTRVTTRKSRLIETLHRIDMEGVAFDLESPESRHERVHQLVQIGEGCSHWLLTIPPVRNQTQEFHLNWHQDVLAAASLSKIERLVILSSTSVYPDEGKMKEMDARMDSISPHSGLSLLECESVYDGSPFSCCILRLGALIGPGRHPAERALNKGWKTPHKRINATSQQDAISACIHGLFQNGMSGPYNVVTPDHPTYADFGKTCSCLGWPKSLGESSAKEPTGREVISEKIVSTGFEFETNNVLEWAKCAGGMRKKLEVPIKGQLLRCDVHYRCNAEDMLLDNPNEVVVFAHGYKGFKDWGAWDRVMDQMATSNRWAVRFDFSHNGVTELFPGEILDEEAWSQNTYHRELEELVAVANYWNSRGCMVHLMGHSRGGGIALLAAHKMERNGIPPASLSLWAAVSDFHERFPKGKALKKWKESNRIDVVNQRTGKVLFHPWSFYTSFMDRASELDIKAAASELSIPVLVAHAMDDEGVDPLEARELHSLLKKSTLWLLDAGGHTFGTKEPWPVSVLPQPMCSLIERTLEHISEA
ncbi:MAG: NAD-dependent epimerase/dehydratase family protein [Flavobacteriales bacterium]|nr:NAD-dependent epimerase/dehydratase family protein [Flavobacteriales bacterium]